MVTLCLVIAVLFCLIALILRLTGVRDRVFGLSLIFYSCQLFVMAFVFALLAVWCQFNKKKIAALICLTISGASLTLWALGGCYFNPDKGKNKNSVRVMCWNTYWGNLGWKNVAAEIKSTNADIVGCVESDSNPFGDNSFWKKRFPGYDFRPFHGAMFLMVRGRILEADSGHLGSGGRYVKAKVSVKGKEITVVLVDVVTNPFISRKIAFGALVTILKEIPGEMPVLVMGDFNTPPDSYFFDELRKKYRHAFETAGSGFLASWPNIAPFLSVDHIWCSKDIKILSCEHPMTWASDHRPVVMNIYYNHDNFQN